MITRDGLINEMNKTKMLEVAGVGGGIPLDILSYAIAGVASLKLLETVREYIRAEPNNHPTLQTALVDFAIEVQTGRA